jgi:L-threonylcarbamoyladenylate synthase
VFDSSGAALRKASEIIKRGGLAAFPTETVYGLGVDAFNTAALARVFEAKNRPHFDPLIIHIASYRSLDRVVLLSALGPDRRALVKKCAAAFWPGPLTLVLPKQPAVPELATAGLSTVAVRCPAHLAALKLIRLCGEKGLPGALAAPSANPFGSLSPTRAEHVIEKLGDKIDCIVDGGPCSVGVESTVLDLCSGEIAVLRPGGITREQLEDVIGPAGSGLRGGPPAVGQITSPGMLKSHYAPQAPLFCHSGEEMAALTRRDDEAYLFFSGKNRRFSGEAVLVLSETGSALEAAANLFEYLHRLDGMRPARIHAEILPEEGIGAAVNDRLRRAGALTAENAD